MDNENDIFVTNGSEFSVAKVALDGIDRGALGKGELRRFDNVDDGMHTIEVFRFADDTTPCDSHTTDYLGGSDDDYWVARCE
ncbi:MAG: hypothetical protein U0166_24390 [Acidobacteriota bacterium]